MYWPSSATLATIAEQQAQATEEYRRTRFRELAEAERKARGLYEDLLKAQHRTALQLLTAPFISAGRPGARLMAAATTPTAMRRSARAMLPRRPSASPAAWIITSRRIRRGLCARRRRHQLGPVNALGRGRSDAFQAGAYGISWFGHAYVAGALAFTNHWFTTNRTALGDQLTANFVGQSYGARLEGGYRTMVLPAFGVTPYAGLQAQDFYLPAYSETDVTGGGFGLSYAAMNATDLRSELGARFDDPTLLYGKPLILFGAWPGRTTG